MHMYICMAAAEDGVRDVPGFRDSRCRMLNSIYGGWTTVTPAQGSLSLSIIIHKRDTGSSAPLRHRVVRKHMPPFFTFPTAGPQARDCQHTLIL